VNPNNGNKEQEEYEELIKQQTSRMRAKSTHDAIKKGNSTKTRLAARKIGHDAPHATSATGDIHSELANLLQDTASASVVGVIAPIKEVESNAHQLGLDSLLEALCDLIASYQTSGGLLMPKDEISNLTDVVMVFLRPLKALIDSAASTTSVWSDETKKLQVSMLVLQLKTKHFVDICNSIKAMNQNVISDAAVFQHSITELNFTLWQLYAATSTGTNAMAVLDKLTKMFSSVKALVELTSKRGGELSEAKVNETLETVVTFAAAMTEYIYATCHVSQQATLYNNLYAAVQGCRAILVASRHLLTSYHPELAKETIPNLLENLVNNVRIFSIIIKTQPQQNTNTEPTTNPNLIGQALRMISDTQSGYLKKATSSAPLDEKEKALLLEWNQLQHAYTNLSSAYAQPTTLSLFGVSAIVEVVKHVDKCIALSSLIVSHWPTTKSKQTVLTAVYGLKQLTLQLRILGAMIGIGNIPLLIDPTLPGYVVRNIVVLFSIVFSVLRP